MGIDVNVVEVAIAIITVVASWAVLRATVSDLKIEVKELKTLIVTVTTIRAEVEIGKSENMRLRNIVDELAQRVAHLEAQGERT